jgi:hypothetical protein
MSSAVRHTPANAGRNKNLHTQAPMADKQPLSAKSVVYQQKPVLMILACGPPRNEPVFISPTTDSQTD